MSEQLASVSDPVASEEGVTPKQGQKPSGPVRWRLNLSSLAAMTFLIICAIYFLLPFFWLVVSATKSPRDMITTFGLWFAPHFNLFTNLRFLFTFNDSIFLQWLLNTLIYAGGGALVATIVASMAGHALAKYIFPGRTTLFGLILGAAMVPPVTLALPLYLLMTNTELINTYWSVLLPGMVSPFGVYLARIYATSAVPDELLEACRIDGGGEFHAYMITLRLMTPALVTIFLFQFGSIWNNFFLPFIMLTDPRLYPITVGLQFLGGGPLLVCGSLVSAIPLLIGCIILQRYWRNGLGTGSVKG